MGLNCSLLCEVEDFHFLLIENRVKELCIINAHFTIRCNLRFLGGLDWYNSSRIS